MANWLDQVQFLRSEGLDHVIVTVIDRRGSVPQDVGAKAIVTAQGLHWGTVGGGKVEAAAIQRAQELLLGGPTEQPTQMLKINLNQDLGMTCGGQVQFLLERSERHANWRILVFGAGHVAQALVPLLANLQVQVICHDERGDWLNRMPERSNVRLVGDADPVELLLSEPKSTQVVIMTKGHATDLPLAQAALGNGYAYVGVIGSQSKAARLRKLLAEAGLTEEQFAQLHCPIGLPIGQNHPQEIALSVAAQLLWYRDQRQGRTAQKWRQQSQETELWAH